MKNKKVLSKARFSVQNFKVFVELWKSYIVYKPLSDDVSSFFSEQTINCQRERTIYGRCKNCIQLNSFSHFFRLPKFLSTDDDEWAVNLEFASGVCAQMNKMATRGQGMPTPGPTSALCRRRWAENYTSLVTTILFFSVKSRYKIDFEWPSSGGNFGNAK